MTGIPGSPPDLRMLPVGCVFHPRCPFVMDICREQSPPLEPPAGSTDRISGRLASCWLQDGSRPVPAELAQPEPGTAPRPASTPTRAPAGPGTPAPDTSAGRLAPSIAAPDPGSQS
jgi:hypothetical protein